MPAQASSTSLDLDFVRGHFPALQTPTALFDNAGGSVTPRPVIDRITRYLETLMVQTGASYGLSQQATASMTAAHQAAATLFGCDPDEVILGHSTTVNAQILANALNLGAGDAVVITNVDHESNVHPWRRLAERGVEVRVWDVDPETATLRLEDLEPHLDHKTRLVCFAQVSNVVGAIADVPAITARVHEAGAKVCVDGVAFAPHRVVDVKAWDVDFYLASLYKIYGPHVGAMYGRRELLLSLPGQYNGVVPETSIPSKFEPGNATHELCAGIPGTLEYLDAVHDHHFTTEVSERSRLARVFDLFAAHEAALAQQLLSFLREHDRVSIVGPTQSDPATRVPTIAFTVDGMGPGDIVAATDRRELALRHGHFYAHALVKRLGLLDGGGVVRVSMTHYNTAGEVQRLVEALAGEFAP